MTETETVTVYRVGKLSPEPPSAFYSANVKLPAGPYCGSVIGGVLNRTIPYSASPAPYEDEITDFHSGHAFGFASPDQARAWFGCVAELLAASGFKVYEITVPSDQVVHGGRQVVFLAEAVIDVGPEHCPIEFFTGAPADLASLRRARRSRRAIQQRRDPVTGRFESYTQREARQAIRRREWNRSALIAASIEWFHRGGSLNWGQSRPTRAAYAPLPVDANNPADKDARRSRDAEMSADRLRLLLTGLSA